MAFIDPKEFLLKHVEKIVLVAALGVLCWTVWAYPPWAGRNPLVDVIRNDMVQIAQGQKVIYVVDKAEAAKDPNKQVPQGIADVENYVRKIQDSIRTPWSAAEEVRPFDPSWVIFEDDIGTVWRKKAPMPPMVEGPTEVVAKAEKNRVIVIFKINQQKERLRLDVSNVAEYSKGLRFYRVVITRQNVTIGNEPPVELNSGTQWLPANLPRYYGPPAETGSRLDEPGPWRTSEDVAIFSQRVATPPLPPPGPDRRRLQLEEELKRQQEEQARLRKAGQVPLTPPPGPGPTPKRPNTPTGAGKVGLSADEQYYWFVDNVETEGKYRYTVSIEVRNPVYKSTAYEDSDQVPEFVSSAATVSSNEVEIAPFKEWHFVGGAQTPEQARCLVKVMTAQERKLDAGEVMKLVAELAEPKGGKAAVGAEPAGEWVKDWFPAKPGEEIGSQKSVKLSGGQAADVDFSTGVQVVLVSEGFQVVESEGNTLKQMPDGTFQRMKVITRQVAPKLSITVMDRKGNVTRKWQETVKD